MNLHGSIPDDNPVFNGARSHIYTYGHRNPQGLVFAPNGLLYSAEHGPRTDDELNLITVGATMAGRWWPATKTTAVTCTRTGRPRHRSHARR